MWERFAEHGPTMAAACGLACLIGSARAVHRWRSRRTKRGCTDLLLCVGCSALLGGAGAAIAAGMFVEDYPCSPWKVVAIGAACGTAVDLTTAAGSLALLRLALRLTSRVSRGIAAEISPDSSQDSDSDAS